MASRLERLAGLFFQLPEETSDRGDIVLDETKKLYVKMTSENQSAGWAL